MSTGSNDVFGIPAEQRGQGPRAGSLPLPSDAASAGRAGYQAPPLPSDALAGDAKPSRRRRRKEDAGKDDRKAGGGTGRNAAPEPALAASPSGKSGLRADDARLRRRKTAVISAILIVLSAVSLFVDAGFARFFNPGEVFASYGLWFQQAIAQIASPSDVMSAHDIALAHQDYYRIVNRVGITVMTALCGAVLAIAGSLYQSAFRNPIAGPSMLGVSSAIQLGDVILVMVFGASAGLMLGYRYLICYACVIVVMVVLFTLTRLMTGKGRPMNVVNLLLVAMIITQIIGVVVTYLTTFVLDWELWQVYNNLSEALNVNLDALSWVVFLVSCAVGLIPVLVLRFRLNGLNFDDAEMRLLGVNANRLRMVALVFGTILLMAAQVQMGTIAMLSLVVPHVSRMVFGAEFRKQLVGCVLIGASLLMFCRIVIGLIPDLGPFLPISVVLNFVVLPFFVWMLATQQRGWEQ